MNMIISTLRKIMAAPTPEPFTPTKEAQDSEKSSEDPIEVVAETQEMQE
jgi:hypothetical protein